MKFLYLVFGIAASAAVGHASSSEKARPIEASASKEVFYPPSQSVEAALAEFAASPKRAGFLGNHRIGDGGPHGEHTFVDLYPGAASKEQMEEERRKYRETGVVPDADWVAYWMSKSDDEIFSMISPDNPRALVPNYQGGYPLWQGSISSLVPIWGRPNWFYSPKDGKMWGPGAEVVNPGTGATVTVEDTGLGWRPPEGFPIRSPFKFVAAYRTYLIRKLIYYPYNDEHGFDGPSYRQHGSVVYSLAYAYAVTGEQKYADRVLLILRTLAQYYSHYTSLDDTGVGWHSYPYRSYVDDHNFENGMILNMALAYDFVWQGIPGSDQLLSFLKKKGIVVATTESLGREIEQKLFAYSWEFIRRAVPGATGNSMFRQMQAALALGNVFRNDVIMEYVVDGPKSLNLSIPGSFYRDGRFWEDTCLYCWVVSHALVDTYNQIAHYHSARYPDGLKLGPAATSTFKELEKHLDDWQVQGRLYGIGDAKNARKPILDDKAPFLSTWTAHEVGLTLLRTSNGRENGSAALLFHGNAGNGHGHLHQLMLKIYGQGYDFTGDLGYPANFAHSKWTDWTRGTLSHPTVVVDRASQNVGTTASLSLRAEAPWGAVASAYSNNVYQPEGGHDVNGKTPSPRILPEGTKSSVSTYHRTAVLLDVAEGRQIVVDLFRVEGGKCHDLPFHAPSGDEGQFFELTGANLGQPRPGTLAGENVAYGERDFEGYSYLKEVTPATTAGAFRATWRPAGEAGPGYRISIPSGFPGEVMVAKGESEGPLGMSPWDRYLLLRHEINPAEKHPLKTTFMAVHETFADKPLDFEVVQLPVTGYSPEQMAVKLALRFADGTVWEIESALNGSPSIYENRGKERIRVTGPKGAMSVNWDEKSSKATPITGKVAAVDYKTNKVTIECGSDLSAMAGRLIAFNHPHYTKATTFEIESVRSLRKDQWELSLKQHPVLARTLIKQTSSSRKILSVDRVSEKLLIAVTLFDGKTIAVGDEILSGRLAYADISSVVIKEGYQKFWLDEALPKGHGEQGELVTVYDYGVGDDALIHYVNLP